MRITIMDIEQICQRVIIRICSNKYIFENYDEPSLRQIINEEIGNQEYSVTHVKDSIKKYGNGNEYVGFDSWIDFWEKRNSSHKKIRTIGICPCCKKPMIQHDGAHVQNSDGKIYITPTCSECNGKAAKDEEFRKKPFYVKYKHLVPFNYNELKKLRYSK